MRLQRHFARTVKGREYFKWVVVIPSEDVIELGWAEGEELKSKMHQGGLLLTSKNK